MDDSGFLAHPPRIRALSRDIDGQRTTPTTLADRLQGVGAVDTGDPSLDGSIRQDLERFVSQLDQFGQALGNDARTLSDNAQAYDATDQQVSGGLDDIASGLGGGQQ